MSGHHGSAPGEAKVKKGQRRPAHITAKSQQPSSSVTARSCLLRQELIAAGSGVCQGGQSSVHEAPTTRMPCCYVCRLYQNVGKKREQLGVTQILLSGAIFARCVPNLRLCSGGERSAEWNQHPTVGMRMRGSVPSVCRGPTAATVAQQSPMRHTNRHQSLPML